MLTSLLFESVLLRPAQDDCDKLFIASGYATAAMAFRHIQAMRALQKNVQVFLIVGMASADGLSNSNHRGFQNLMQNDFVNNFECSYLYIPPPVHSKVYVWCKGSRPVSAFLGSANYTQMAFGAAQREAMTPCDSIAALDYYHSLVSNSIYCTHADADSLVQIYNDRYFARRRRETTPQGHDTIGPETPTPQDLLGLLHINVSLLDRNGQVPERSGLNWGQRPEEHRDPNQAYIRLPAEIYNTDFFPERTIHFTVLTDDSRVLVCTRAQDNGKAIHTPHNNSLIGEYFRNRLGLANGAPVTLSDLQRYGRTSIDFYKIDAETYFMDFSLVNRG